MSISNIIKTGIIVFDGSSDVTVFGGNTISIDPGIKEVKEYAAGQVSPSYISVMSAEPMINGTVYDLATLAAAGVGVNPLPVGSGQTYTAVAVYGTAAAELGTVAAYNASSHTKYNVAKGLAILKSFSCRQGQTASGVLEIHAARSAADTDPIVLSTGQAMPTLPVLTECFTLGSFAINGSTINGVVGIDYDSGITVTKEYDAGGVDPSYVYISQIAPKITLTLKDATYLNSFTMYGTAVGASAFTGYLQKLANKSSRVAAATAEHFKITGTASQGMIIPRAASLQQQTGEVQVDIHPIVGSSAILAFSKAAIS